MAFRLPSHPDAFSLDKPQKRSQRAKASPKHLDFIRHLPCCVCGSWRDVEAAHIRFASPVHNKPGTAMAQKPDDRWTVPLCAGDHRTGPDAQHNSNEREWWDRKGIDCVGLAIDLFKITGDEKEGCRLVRKASPSRSAAPRVSRAR